MEHLWWLLLVFITFEVLFASKNWFKYEAFITFWLLFIYFLVRGHSLITGAKKIFFFLNLPFCEYVTVHFSTYPPSLHIHAYAKWFNLIKKKKKKKKLSTPLSFIFILKKCDWLKMLDVTHITLVNNVYCIRTKNYI